MGISSHLDLKQYQIATTTDPTLPTRKWNHLRHTIWDVSAKSAAYKVNKSGDIVSQSGNVFRFPDGQYVCVGW